MLDIFCILCYNERYDTCVRAPAFAFFHIERSVMNHNANTATAGLHNLEVGVEEVKKESQMRYVAAKAVYYRASDRLRECELVELNRWLMEQSDPKFGSIALIVGDVTFTEGRPESVLTVNFTAPASLGAVECVVTLIDWWVKNPPPE